MIRLRAVASLGSLLLLLLGGTAAGSGDELREFIDAKDKVYLAGLPRRVFVKERFEGTWMESGREVYTFDGKLQAMENIRQRVGADSPWRPWFRQYWAYSGAEWFFAKRDDDKKEWNGLVSRDPPTVDLDWSLVNLWRIPVSGKSLGETLKDGVIVRSEETADGSTVVVDLAVNSTVAERLAKRQKLVATLGWVVTIDKAKEWRPIEVAVVIAPEGTESDPRIPTVRFGSAPSLPVESRLAFSGWQVIAGQQVPTEYRHTRYVTPKAGRSVYSPSVLSCSAEVSVVAELPEAVGFQFLPPRPFGDRGRVMDRIRGTTTLVDLGGNLQPVEQEAAVEELVDVESVSDRPLGMSRGTWRLVVLGAGIGGGILLLMGIRWLKRSKRGRERA